MRTFRVEQDMLPRGYSIYDPPPEFQEYDLALKHYYIDDVEVNEAEYTKALNEEKRNIEENRKHS